MNWDTIQQLIRIGGYAAGGAIFGQAVADGAQFQQALGGVISIGSFAWWWFWDRKRQA